ncbi:MAG: phosphoadenosine phosphosulfate reductase domain-containing protein [Methermicoccaceae archaeon]
MSSRRKRGMPNVGKNHLHWCEHCGLPVLDRRCGICGNDTKKIEITPPADVRVAFEADVHHINERVHAQFGCELLNAHEPVVLSKAPYMDRMDEVVARGCVLGSLRFELDSMSWVFLPRVGAARAMQPTRGMVEVDEGAVEPILSGGGVLSPGVVRASSDIRAGDEVLVYHEKEPIACGRARMDAADMGHTRGLAVKVRWRNGSEPSEPVCFTSHEKIREKMVEANLHVLTAMSDEALAFIRKVAESTTLPLTVSYSGGKDSLAVLLLCLEALDNVDVLFANTGLEFPETVENVDEVVKARGLKLVKSDAKEAFWDALAMFGPPTVEMRWCCKVCKLGPLAKLIAEHYPEGCLSFIGQRKYESEARAKSRRVWKNPWVINQVGAAPIQHWTSMHVWLYIFYKNAPYNPLYEMGYDRIGCWLCPSSSVADLLSLKSTHPELSSRWEAALLQYAKAHKLSEKWASLGFWRWSEPPHELAQLEERFGIEHVPAHSPTLEFSDSSGIRTCTGGFSAEGKYSNGLDVPMLASSGQLRLIGQTLATDRAVIAHSKQVKVHVYASGAVVARAESEKGAKAALKLAELLIQRAYACTGCGACVPHCPVNAIEVGKRATITEECTACGRCLVACPAIRYDPLNITER